jgi:hypothetical protein
VGKISLRHHRGPTPAEVFKILFGKEAEVDERTGQLIYPVVPPDGPEPSPTFGTGTQASQT